MGEAAIGLISAVAVVIIGKLFDYIMDRRKRKDTLEDREVEKRENNGNNQKEIMGAIREIKNDMASIKASVSALNTDLQSTRKDVQECQKEVLNVKYEAEEGRIVEARIRILRFASEIDTGMKHSKDQFDQVISDIDLYSRYCDSHPNFKNGYTVASVELINTTFKRVRENHDFLS